MQKLIANAFIPSNCLVVNYSKNLFKNMLFHMLTFTEHFLNLYVIFLYNVINNLF